MLKGYKVVVCIPSGRRRYMEILLGYLSKVDIIDEIQLWVNTNSEDDLVWFDLISKGKIRKIILNDIVEYSNYTISRFYKYAFKSNTVYIRLDDDVVWIEDGAIEELARKRIENPKPFLVYPNIINNSVFSYIHKFIGNYENIDGFTNDVFCNVGWNNGEVAELIHMEFIDKLLKNKIDDFRFKSMILKDYSRVSINVISWFGDDFRRNIEPDSEIDEEQELSTDIPKKLSRPNFLIGNKIFSHFSYCTQRGYLDRTDILDLYQQPFFKKDYVF